MLKHAQTFTVNSSLFCITPDDVSESIRNIDSGSERERKPTSDIKTPSLFRSYRPVVESPVQVACAGFFVGLLNTVTNTSNIPRWTNCK